MTKISERYTTPALATCQLRMRTIACASQSGRCHHPNRLPRCREQEQWHWMINRCHRTGQNDPLHQNFSNDKSGPPRQGDDVDVVAVAAFEDQRKNNPAKQQESTATLKDFKTTFKPVSSRINHHHTPPPDTQRRHPLRQERHNRGGPWSTRDYPSQQGFCRPGPSKHKERST